VKLEKENYWDWQKKLEISSGQSTFAEDIFLFKKDIPIMVQNSEFQTISYSPEKKKAVSLSSENVSLVNLAKEEINTYKISTSTFIDAPINKPTIQWSQKQEKVILNNFIFSDRDWNHPIDLEKLTKLKISNIKWGKNDNQIFFENNSWLNYFDIESKSLHKIVSPASSLDYLPKNNVLYYLDQKYPVPEWIQTTSDKNHGSNQSNTLVVWDIPKNEEVKKINLPISNYSFINKNHPLINLYDNNNQILYLIDPYSQLRPLKESINNIILTEWISDDRLMYANNFEIWILDLNTYKRTLLTRISDPIKSIKWHPNNNYIIYSTNNYINTIELDDREKYNITRLIDLQNINFLEIDNKGNMIYFFATIGKQKGLYKLLIQ